MIKKLLFPMIALGAGAISVVMTHDVGAAPQRTQVRVPTATQVYSAKMSAALQSKLATLQDNQSAGVVLISFHTGNGLAGVPNLDTPVTGLLARNGITPAARLEVIGIISAVLTKAQVNALRAEPDVRSLWDNYRLHYDLNQARVLTGVDKLRADPVLSPASDPIDGGDLAPDAGATPPQPNKPRFSCVVIDSGIDTTGVPQMDPTTMQPYEADLKFTPPVPAGVQNSDIPPSGYIVAPVIPNTKVIQNIQVTGDETAGTLTFTENQVNNDSVGHGSHTAGIVGGLGTFGRNTPATTAANSEPTGPEVGKTHDFSGAARGDPGLRIIGSGSGAGLFVLDALGGFTYAMNFQTFYNIRITSNSYGSNGDYDPDDPLNIAIKAAYDRNITNVFSAGNDGSINTINNSSKSPYVINVAAGTKEGGLASFSSRGLPKGERGGPGSIHEFNLPAITAPGAGREFDSNAPDATNGTRKRFYSDMISTRSKFPGAAAGTNDQELPAPYEAVYTQISGTSMSCPFISGVCGLLLDVNPNFSPALMKEIIQKTATRMPGREDWEVGAGYVNVYAAIDEAKNPSKPYAVMYPSTFNTPVVPTLLPPPARPPTYPPATPQAGSSATAGEKFTMPYTPSGVPAADYNAAKTKAQAYPNNNAYAFNVVPDAMTGKTTDVLDVRIQFGQESLGGEVGGNSLGLYLWAPDGTFYSSGPTLPILNYPSRQVVVLNPKQGLWVAELRPVRGLAAVPVTPPGGVGLPDTTTGQIFRTNLAVTDPNDIGEVAQRAAIRAALRNRFLDAFPDPINGGGGLFKPTAQVTRGDFLKTMVLNTPLRQSLASSTKRFADLTPEVSRWAEAATRNGSTLRDFDFTPGPLIEVSAGPNFSPDTALTRLKIAVALVRALGLDEEAKALRDVNPVTYTYKGTKYPVLDITPYNPAEPGANTQNGYLQLAINRGLLPITPTVRPGSVTVRAYPLKPMIRADLATAIVNFRAIFSFGNTIDASETPTGDPPES